MGTAAEMAGSRMSASGKRNAEAAVRLGRLRSGREDPAKFPKELLNVLSLRLGFAGRNLETCGRDRLLLRHMRARLRTT